MGDFQSVNQLNAEIISQGSLKIMWFVDRHYSIHVSASALKGDKLGNLHNLSESQFSYL